MANVLMLNRQKKLVGSVDYAFTQRAMPSYLSLQIEKDTEARFHLAKSTLHNATGQALADLVCGTNSRGSFADVVVTGSRLGHVQGTIAHVKAAGRWSSVGSVIRKRVKRDGWGIVGELFLQWDSGDEICFQVHVQSYANANGIPLREARVIFDDCRPALYQNLMDFAGCAALILQLFTSSRSVDLPRYSQPPVM